ncbi:MAG TPA: acyl-CoA dehydrogenase family protein [bacterium]|nr:acyl-CoA dehydrogenase family protein [bacterium]
MELFPPMVEESFVARLRADVAAVVAPIAAKTDRDDVYPLEAVRALAARGYNAVHVPAENGGGGKSFSHCVAVFEEVAYASAATATSLITIFQSAEILKLYGSPALKKRFLPGIARGLCCSYAMTEAAHGSDVKHLDTKAVRDGDGWRIDGEKSFVTSASAAELFVILAETPAGVSAFAVPRDTPGAQTITAPGSATFGLRNGPHVNFRLNGARVPLENLIGEEGHGVRLAVTTLDHSRVLAGAIGVGIARAAFDGAMAFARERSAFGQHVLEFQGIQWYFADMLTDIDAARNLVYDAARHLDEGKQIERYSSEAKLFASRISVAAAEKAIQICGARGCIEDAPFSRYLRDAKTYEIAGGSSEILRNTIGKFLLKAEIPPEPKTAGA